VPEDREGAAVGCRPVEQVQEPRLGTLGRQAEIALLRQRRVHRGERDLENVRGRVALEVPRVERPRNPRAKADRVREAERRVVAERQRINVPVRIAAQVVVAVARQRTGERFELCLLIGEA